MPLLGIELETVVDPESAVEVRMTGQLAALITLTSVGAYAHLQNKGAVPKVFQNLPVEVDNDAPPDEVRFVDKDKNVVRLYKWQSS